MPDVLWSRSLDGERPDLLLGEDSILLHYTAAGRQEGGTEIICYDRAGSERWARAGWSVMLSLPGSRFLVNTSEGRPLVVNSEGDVLHRWESGGVEWARRHGDTLLLAGKSQVWAADIEFRRLWQAAWPGQSGPACHCFVGGTFYWVADDHLRSCTPGEQPDVICRLPADLIAGAMNEWEQRTGNSALAGWYIREGMSDVVPFQRGDRPFSFYWRVAFDEDAGQFLLANATAPHLILCLDRSGEPRWCKYTSSGCCGGIPSRLPNGLYVASSGCGGILSWLDGDGAILFQSKPHEGVGLATAYSHEVEVLPDGRCLVDGGPGVVAYGPTGDRLWVFGQGCCRYRCDATREILAGCYWQDNEPKARNRVCLELAHGL
jgi:hypothetical protein